MKKLIILLTAILTSCTDESGTEEILKGQGYLDIEIQGFSIFGCSQEDLFRTEFAAKSSNGTPVDGVVCKGIFKGSTIRFD